MAQLGQLGLAWVARSYLSSLAEQINATVLLVVPHGDRATIVDKVDGGRVAVEVSATVGRRIRIAAGACGKVFLAFSDDSDRMRHLAALTHPTPRTLLDPSLYELELDHLRRVGYAT